MSKSIVKNKKAKWSKSKTKASDWKDLPGKLKQLTRTWFYFEELTDKTVHSGMSIDIHLAIPN